LLEKLRVTTENVLIGPGLPWDVTWTAYKLRDIFIIGLFFKEFS
jgi:hypothetical protein